jgi:hypothetical protein
MVPQEKIGWKEFEKRILMAGKRLEDAGLLSLGKYGVQASIMGDGKGGMTHRPIQSLPDFEGAWSPLGRQMIIEAKVCAAASLSLVDASKKVTTRQIRHLIRRSRVGVGSWLVVHWNARALVRGTVPAVTTAIPVVWDGRWQAIERDEIKSIGYDTALEIGVSLAVGCRGPGPRGCSRSAAVGSRGRGCH